VGKDNMEHFIRECRVTSDWFKEVGENRDDIWKRVWSDEIERRGRY